MSKDDARRAIRRKERRSAEIAAFAAKNAGTNLDLDRDLEEAGLEVIEAAERKSLKPIPKFESEDEERKFWMTHDSTEHVDWSRAKPTAFSGLKPSSR